jgi:hypothetical protein
VERSTSMIVSKSFVIADWTAAPFAEHDSELLT